MYRRPSLCSIRTLLLAMSCSAFSFFFFSFHVHEKTILFPLLPIALLQSEFPFLVPFFSVAACFSMFPLLAREKLTLPLLALQILFVSLSSFASSSLRKGSRRVEIAIATVFSTVSFFLLWGFYGVPAPPTLPDLFPLLITSFSFCVFVVIFVSLNHRLFIFKSSENAKIN